MKKSYYLYILIAFLIFIILPIVIYVVAKNMNKNTTGKSYDNSYGLCIAVPEKYIDLCVHNLKQLKSLGYTGGIEIWQDGNELSDDSVDKIRAINNTVVFRYVGHESNNESQEVNESHEWRGFQIKAYMLKYTTFTHVIICDADVRFYQNPSVIWDNEQYKNTGTYFFKDLEKWQFNIQPNADHPDKFHSLEFFNHRKEFIRSLIPQSTSLFPKSWSYIYDDEYPKHPVPEALQESGVVYMNKTIHSDSVQHIFDLNKNHAHTYKYIWGDKETFWLGCVMSNTPYYFNDTFGYFQDNGVHHNYKNTLFWRQK